MNPRDFLDVADALVTGLGEAEWRSGVSRAYYAAFHVARRLLSDSGFDVARGEQTHAYLWLRLANSNHADVRNAGNDLYHLRQKRNQADYDLEQPLYQATCAGHIQLAERIIELLEMVAADPAIRTRIIDAMKIYERDVLGQVTWRP
jgi:uncharacterized protein (UPF0332 family)